MRIRKKRIAPQKKTKWSIKDGPYKGQTLWLSTGTTLPFSVNGFRGRYVSGCWIQAGE